SATWEAWSSRTTAQWLYSVRRGRRCALSTGCWRSWSASRAWRCGCSPRRPEDDGGESSTGVVPVDQGVSPGARDEVPVGEEGERIGDREPGRDARVEQQIAQARVDGAGDDEHGRVVDHLH